MGSDPIARPIPGLRAEHAGPTPLLSPRSAARAVARLGPRLGVGIAGARLEAFGLLDRLGIHDVAVGASERLDGLGLDCATVEIAVLLGGDRPRRAYGGRVAVEQPAQP